MDRNKVLELASELFITLTPEDEKTLLSVFETFAEDAKLLNIPGIDDVEPLIFPHDRTSTYLREDIVDVGPSREEILKNSKNKKGDYIVIPKVVK